MCIQNFNAVSIQGCFESGMYSFIIAYIVYLYIYNNDLKKFTIVYDYYYIDICVTRLVSIAQVLLYIHNIHTYTVNSR